jgi:surfeit locus 1 family protein
MTMKPKKIPVNPLLVVVFLSCLTLLLGLGGWQFKRGLAKAAIEYRIGQSGETVERLARRPLHWKTLAYRTVELEGIWLDRFFLLDNRIFKGQPGYELLAPIQLDGDNSVLLVNLGWLEKRSSGLPSLDNIRSFAGTAGQLYLPKKGFTLGNAYSDPGSWPRVIQYIDTGQLAEALGMSLEPAVVVMDGNGELGTTRIWQPYVMNASRHYGYAVQWWGLAIVLVVFGIIWYKRG